MCYNIQKNPLSDKKRNPKFVTLPIKKVDDLKTEDDIEKAEIKLRNVLMQVAEYEKNIQIAKAKLNNSSNQADDQTVVVEHQAMIDLLFPESMKHFQEWSVDAITDDHEKEYVRWLWPKLKAESKAIGGNEKNCFFHLCAAAKKTIGPNYTTEQFVSVCNNVFFFLHICVLYNSVSYDIIFIVFVFIAIYI